MGMSHAEARDARAQVQSLLQRLPASDLLTLRESLVREERSPERLLALLHLVGAQYDAVLRDQMERSGAQGQVRGLQAEVALGDGHWLLHSAHLRLQDAATSAGCTGWWATRDWTVPSQGARYLVADPDAGSSRRRKERGRVQVVVLEARPPVHEWRVVLQSPAGVHDVSLAAWTGMLPDLIPTPVAPAEVA